MASSRHIVASPHEIPAGPGRRERWADNLRALVIGIVVVWHTATAYLGGSDWYYTDRATSKLWTTAFFPASVISLFALGPLFLVAGWFSARSLAQRGADAFARARLLRLGVPLIVFIFVINPLASYLGGLGRGLHPVLADYWGGGAYAAGVMRFVAALLAFSLAYALLRRAHAPPVTRRWSSMGWAAMAGMVLYGILSVAFTVWFTALIRARWSGDGPLRVRAGRASYATYVLHPVVLTAIMVVFASLALAPELTFLVVAMVAVPVCFLAGYAATRMPGLSKVL